MDSTVSAVLVGILSCLLILIAYKILSRKAKDEGENAAAPEGARSAENARRAEQG